MSGKRQAAYSIDPTTLQQKEKYQQDQAQGKTKSKQQQKQARQIFRIKRPEENVSEDKKQSKVAFKLSESQNIDNPNDTQTEKNKKQQIVVNPFANLFKNSENFNGIGIFSNLNQSKNLFTVNKGSQKQDLKVNPTYTNIFTSQRSSLFDNSIKNTNSSLFSKKNATEQQDDGSGDSAELQKAQNIQAEPQKSTASFDYGDTCPVVFTIKASKFKKGAADLIENVEIILQKDKSTQLKYISVRLPATKTKIFSGLIIEGRSSLRHINGKKQNIQVEAFYKEKQGLSKCFLKFQFQKAEDGQKTYQRLEQLLKKTNKQENSQK